MARLFTYVGMALCCIHGFCCDAAATADGKTYTVKVLSSFGTKFADCFSFDDSGHLTVSGYGRLVYTSKDFGRSNGWQAVAPKAMAAKAEFEIVFDGIAVGGAKGRLHATGNNESGDYFYITGFAGGACRSRVGTWISPYRGPAAASAR